MVTGGHTLLRGFFRVRSRGDQLMGEPINRENSTLL